jgi:protein-S-isoprenylcysteine O-methyltransferase Ste14
MMSKRSRADWMLLVVTLVDLAVLAAATREEFTYFDVVYILQHLTVLVLALSRPAPVSVDSSLVSLSACAVSYTYPYLLLLAASSKSSIAGVAPTAGFFLTSVSAVASLTALATLGRSFGIRPALRRVRTRGVYGVVRHPLYLSYFVSDVGFLLTYSDVVPASLTAVGWVSMIVRILHEESALSQDPSWASYAARTRFRLVPLVW